MLEDVIKHFPPTWSQEHDTPLEIEINRYDDEYQKVAEPFKSMNIARMHRLQNPYMWGRFILRKEQMKMIDGHAYELTMYHPISPNDVHIIKEYNCDYRRYSNAKSSQYVDKKPIFYQNPQTAKEMFVTTDQEECSIVVVRTLSLHLAYHHVPETNHETEYVPVYVVSLL